ncbi:MAG: hypothetical protein V2G44_06995 [bacterium JZ-2024 1]
MTYALLASDSDALPVSPPLPCQQLILAFLVESLIGLAGSDRLPEISRPFLPRAFL